jgi:glycogen(starch) synthase
MRVLTVIHLYPPHHLGGYEVACQGVMERFAECGIEVAVLTADQRMEGVEEPPSSPVEVRRLLGGWWDWTTWAPARLTLRQRLALERHNQRALGRTLDEFRPDVVSVWDLGMMSWSLASLVERRGIPTVLTFLDDWITYAYVFDGWTRMFERRPWMRPLGAALGLETRLPSFRGARASVASRMIGDAIKSRSRWQFPDAELVPIGVETRDFPISEPRSAQWSGRLLYAGRVVREKGVATLVRALPLLPSGTSLHIVGHGHQSEIHALTELAGDLGVAERVRFSVAASRRQLRQAYVDADALVFPSEWPEPFGLVPLEAMACGTPVVATGTGGSGEYLEDGWNCLVFPPGDADALAGCLSRLGQDAQLRARIVLGGTATAQRLTMDVCAQRLEALHRRAGAEGWAPVAA